MKSIFISWITNQIKFVKWKNLGSNHPIDEIQFHFSTSEPGWVCKVIRTLNSNTRTEQNRYYNTTQNMTNMGPVHITKTPTLQQPPYIINKGSRKIAQLVLKRRQKLQLKRWHHLEDRGLSSLQQQFHEYRIIDMSAKTMGAHLCNKNSENM